MKHLCWLAALMWAASASAQEDVKTWKISPGDVAVPALRYRLLPDLRDQKPGNAAVFYQRAHSPEFMTALRNNKDFDKMADWLALPAKDFPREKAQVLLASRGVLAELDRASRLESCDWQLTPRLREEGLGMLIPDVQAFRQMSMLIAVRSYEDLLEKKYDRFIASTQSGLMLGRRVGDGPMLLNGLVGVSITATQLQAIERFLETPGTPNLYWALTSLPTPFIDLRSAFEGERMLIDHIIPEGREALANPRHPGPSALKLREFLAQINANDDNLWKKLLEGVMLQKMHIEAKKMLSKGGRTEEEIKKLSAEQAVALLAVAEYDRAFDEVAKWTTLPYWEASAGLRKATEEARKNPGHTQLAGLLMPAMPKVLDARTRLDRSIAMLRLHEALRLYAFHYDGKLPAKLDDIRIVPLPIDPVTGKMFAYEFKDGKATVNLVVEGFSAPLKRIEITR